MEQKKAASYLADNIKYLRSKKNFSQEKLAELSGIPRTTLTNMESGMGNPSLNNLISVSEALGVGLEELISRPRSECLLVKEKDIKEKKRNNVSVYTLLPDQLKGIAIERMEFKGNSLMKGQPHLAGTKEYLIVLKGVVKVYVAGETFLVSKGDVFAFPGNQPHSYQNPENELSTAISVVIPIPASA